MEMTLEQAEKEFVLRRKHGKIHIKKYIGSGGKVVIPGYIGGLPVTKIDSWAFSGLPYDPDVNEIVIPDTVRCIGSAAFELCKSLKKVSLCSKVRIGRCAFYNSGLEEITGVEYISGDDMNMAFDHTPFYENNEEFIVGDNLLWCHKEADEYIVPPHIKTIYYGAFRHSKIRKVILPEGLKEISSLAFYGAETECLNVPDSVEKVGRNAFYNIHGLREISLPENFGKREGWETPIGLEMTVINDTQLNVDNNDDVLEYKDVSCVFCEDNNMNYSSKQREKQVFPARMEYLKNPRLLSYAYVNVFMNDTFKVGNGRKAFEPGLIYKTQYRESRRRFRLVFELSDVHAEVLMYFPMLPFWSIGVVHPELIDFYNACITNDSKGRFFDFDMYDGHILEQDIPFRIKAEIACERCKSGYRLSAAARKQYKEYFTYHRKKLERMLQKDGYDKLREFFEWFLMN